MQKYRTIVADPPWPMKTLGSMQKKRNMRPANLVYHTMTIDQIKQMEVAAFAETGAHLWLWAVNQLLEEAFRVMRAWGFTYHNIITWKKSSGAGCYFITRTQHVLFGYKGKLEFNRSRYIPNDYDWEDDGGPVPVDELYRWPNPTVHSRKPSGSYQLIESVSDEARLEIFARPITPMFPKIDGWDVFGNEVESDMLITTRLDEIPF